MKILARPEKNAGVQAVQVGDEGDLDEVFVREKRPTVRYSTDADDEVSSGETPSRSSKRSSTKTSASSLSSVIETTLPIAGTSAASIQPFKTPSPPTRTAISAKRTSRTVKAQKIKDNNAKRNLLTELIMENPSEFGVKGKQIINPQTGKAVDKSDLSWAIDHLIEPTYSTPGSPPGIKILKKQVLAHEVARQLVHPKHLQKGQGKFYPIKWTR
jgi:hypothetical protein